MKNSSMRHYVLSQILIGAISLAGFAQQPSATPSVERIREHVTYLASDTLEGRRTGTAGANDAAHYIAGEFSQIGLRPAFQTIRNPKNRGEARSNYRQKFPYVAGVKLGARNMLSFTGVNGSAGNLNVDNDWMPLGFSSNASLEKVPIAFVGFGITAAEQKHDDYAGIDVHTKIAIALTGTPDGENPHGSFARYEDVRWKAIAARNAGAKALLLIAGNENFKEDRLSRLHYDNSGGDAGLPVAVISRQSAQRLLGTSLPELETMAKSETAKNLNTSRLTVNLTTEVVRQEVAAFNIIGILDGSDPTLKNEAIVIGAHYDHLGLGGEGSLAPKEGEVHHGADDNASGVAGMLELAKALSLQRPKPRRTIIFMAFSGEEEGLLGSNFYVNNPVVPLSNTVAMINMDMIGRMKDKKLIVGGIGTAQEWRELIGNANLMQGMTVSTNGSAAHAGVPMVVGSNGATVVSNNAAMQFQLTLNEDGYGPSDHSSFYSKQVPVLFFWTGTHSDYHKPSDTADKINYDDEARILGMVYRVVREIDASNKRPTYTVAKSDAQAGRSTGFRVYLGTIPNYAETSDGLLLDGVREDSPASKAGLKAGDRIVKLAGRDVRNVYDYTYALGELKAGEEYEVELVRGAQRLKLKITPAARK